MKRANRTALVGLIIGLALSGTSAAQTTSFYSELDGPQAATGSLAFGSATLTLDTAANTLDYTLQFSNLIGNQISAHIHGPADPGQDGSIVHGIALGSPVTGSWNYPEVFEADILAGRKRHRTYRQLKMYNDPALNPYLYNRGEQAA